MRYRRTYVEYVCTLIFVANWLRKEKSVSRTSASIHKGAKLAEGTKLQYVGYSGQALDPFTQKESSA